MDIVVPCNKHVQCQLGHAAVREDVLDKMS